MSRITTHRPAAPPIPTERFIGPEELRLLADPVREHLVNALVPRARTVAEVAEGLGCAPTRLYRHVQLLLDAGLLVVEREVKVRGVVERHYRAAARTLRLRRPQFAAAAGDAGIEAILAYALDQSRRDIAGAVAAGHIDPLHRHPDPRAVLAWRCVARVTAAEHARLQKRALALYNEVERLGRRAAPQGALFALSVALFPCDPVGQRARRVAKAPSAGDRPRARARGPGGSGPATVAQRTVRRTSRHPKESR
ncbi:MAG: helix-turn-helix domain-containing protein [Xanthomonadaceae bacterium]|jgi:predicted transcriptional regulator|nr:helix-turn-helix domain-containing protein [Xanthomonadaceae bacterium]